MKPQFKGVICSGENISFPYTVRYEGEDYPVLANQQIVGGEYLLAVLDTAGDPIFVTPVSVQTPRVPKGPLVNRYGRKDGREPLIRMSYWREDRSLKVHSYIDVKTLRLAGLYVVKNGHGEYVPVKQSPYTRFQPKAGGQGYVMATNRYVTLENGIDLTIQLEAVVDERGVMSIRGMPDSVYEVVFQGAINYSSTGYIGTCRKPTAVLLLNLDNHRYEESASVVIYDNQSYCVIGCGPQPDEPLTLVIAFSGKPRESEVVFQMLVWPHGEAVLPVTHPLPFSFAD